ncbi:MAG: NUDIX hydrolase [Magnetospirillum sp.]|nr:NUDIX hydrolase [Magnetospirillum sp.]
MVLAYSDPANRWVELYFDRVRFPDGREGRYNRLVAGGGHPGVVVLPLKGGRIGLARQFRYPIGRWMWELPRGFGESDDAAVNARRELFEEMGETAAELIDLGVHHPDSGMVETEVRMFAALCPPQAVSLPDQPGEIHSIRWVSEAELMAEIATDAISDGFTLSALIKAKSRGLL